MKNQNIRRLWENFISDDKYKKYFLSNEDEWKQNLKQVKKYIDENQQRPSVDKNSDVKQMGQWLQTQLTNYP